LEQLGKANNHYLDISDIWIWCFDISFRIERKNHFNFNRL
jgi:hypothetical protein